MDKKLIPVLVMFIQVISLAHAFTGTGSVVKNNEPVSDLSLTLGIVKEEGILEVLSAKTNTDGNFNFGELNNGFTYLISFVVDGKNHRWVLNEGSGDIAIGAGIKGRLIKKDGTPIAGGEITFSDEFGDLDKAISDNDGYFAFNGLIQGKTYTTKTNVNEVDFTSTIVAPGEAALRVLDVTPDDLGIEVLDHEIVFQPSEGMLDVYEFIVYANRGEAVYKNDKIYIALPTERKLASSNLMECCFKEDVDHALADPMKPLFPEETFEVSINYKIPIEAAGYSYLKEVRYPTKFFGFFVLDNGIQVAGESELMEFAGKKYRTITSKEVPAKSSMMLELAGLKTLQVELQKMESQKEIRPLSLAIAGVGILIIVASVVALAYQRHASVLGRLPQQVQGRKRLILVAGLLAVVAAAFAVWGYTSIYKENSQHSQEAYEKAVASEDKENPCAVPEGYTEETWNDHIGHHPEQYSDCLKGGV